MLRQIILAIVILSVSSCSSNTIEYFKKTPNQRLLEVNRLKHNKRMPLYNKKYILQAKKNVVNTDYDFDEDQADIESEERNIAQENIAMYKAMIEQDLANDYPQSRLKEAKVGSYPSLEAIQQRTPDVDYQKQNQELKEEINQIKMMLQATREEVANSRANHTKQHSSNHTRRNSDHTNTRSTHPAAQAMAHATPSTIAPNTKDIKELKPYSVAPTKKNLPTPLPAKSTAKSTSSLPSTHTQSTKLTPQRLDPQPLVPHTKSLPLPQLSQPQSLPKADNIKPAIPTPTPAISEPVLSPAKDLESKPTLTDKQSPKLPTQATPPVSQVSPAPLSEMPPVLPNQSLMPKYQEQNTDTIEKDEVIKSL